MKIGNLYPFAGWNMWRHVSGTATLYPGPHALLPCRSGVETLGNRGHVSPTIWEIGQIEMSGRGGKLLFCHFCVYPRRGQMYINKSHVCSYCHTFMSAQRTPKKIYKEVKTSILLLADFVGQSVTLHTGRICLKIVTQDYLSL